MSRIHVFLLVLFTASCTPDLSQDAKLNNYLVEKLGIPPGQLPSAIFVVTEEGCPPCQKVFADLVRPRTSCPQCLFLIRAEGSSVDLKGFMEETDRIRFDYDRNFKQLGILEGSGAVILDHDRIDTVISLKVDEVKVQLKYMSTILDSLCSRR